MSQTTEWAHLRPVFVPYCRRCRKTATEQLFNGLNESIAYFCGKCARPALKKFKEGNGL